MDYRRTDRRAGTDRRATGSTATPGERRSDSDRRGPDRRVRVPDATAFTSAIDPTPRPVRALRRICARLDDLESRLGLGYRAAR